MEVKNKKAAFEMSMSTIIIIVLSIVFLILGLVLIRNIFGTSTESIDKISNQMNKEIEKMFTDEQKKVIVYLGTDKTANIRAATSGFSFWLAAKTLYGNSAAGPTTNQFSGIQYTLELDKDSECYKKIGGPNVQKWFIKQKLSTSNSTLNDITEFDDGDTALAKIQLSIPDGTTLCSQDVKVVFYDNTQEQKLLPIGGTTFTIRVLRKALI
jgi:hypothetical protein